MAKAVSILDDPSALALPEDLENFLNEQANVVPKETVPSLSYEGKQWTVSVGGEKTVLKGKNAEGDEVPVSVMRVIVLDYAKRRGRAFYEGAYDKDKVARPACWSVDGITPDATVPVDTKQANKCDGCPMAIKGSKVTEQNKATTACSQHRMVAVIPANRLDFEPLRLKLAITSDYDGQSPDLEAEGWYAFNNFTQMLEKRGIPHTARFITKMKFDGSVPYPKVIFAADKLLPVESLRQIIPLLKKGTPENDKVQALISGGFTPDGVDGVKVEAAATTTKPAAAATTTKPATAKGPTPAEVKAAAEKKAAAEAQAKKDAAKAAAKAAYEKALKDAEGEAEVEEAPTEEVVEEVQDTAGEDDVQAEMPEPAKPKAAAKATGAKAAGKAPKADTPKTGEIIPPGTASAGDDLDTLLSDWTGA